MSLHLTDLSYAELCGLTGQRVNTMTGRPGVTLWLEFTSAPVTFGGQTTYTVGLTGPVETVLERGLYTLRTAGIEFILLLEPVGKDVRYVHYEAVCTEPSGE